MYLIVSFCLFLTTVTLLLENISIWAFIMDLSFCSNPERPDRQVCCEVFLHLRDRRAYALPSMYNSVIDTLSNSVRSF